MHKELNTQFDTCSVLMLLLLATKSAAAATQDHGRQTKNNYVFVN